MSAVLVDSSVVLDILTDDAVFASRAVAAMADLGSLHDLVIDDIVYAEVSVGFARIEELDEAIAGCGFMHMPIPREALFLAGKAFLAYRRRGGARSAPLPDFIIGAHAAVAGIPLLTRDPDRIASAYPKVKLIAP